MPNEAQKFGHLKLITIACGICIPITTGAVVLFLHLDADQFHAPEAFDEQRAHERALAVESATQAFAINLSKELPDLTKDQVELVSSLVRRTEQQRQSIQEKWAALPPSQWNVPAYYEEIVALEHQLDQQILQILPQEWHATYLSWRMIGGPYLQYQTSTKDP